MNPDRSATPWPVELAKIALSRPVEGRQSISTSIPIENGGAELEMSGYVRRDGKTLILEDVSVFASKDKSELNSSYTGLILRVWHAFSDIVSASGYSFVNLRSFDKKRRRDRSVTICLEKTHQDQTQNNKRRNERERTNK